MPKRVIINENAVRAKMGAMGIRNLSELTRRAGLGANTIYGVLGSGFHSTTLDTLVTFFECEPGELLSVKEVDADTQEEAPGGVTEREVVATA